MKTKNIKTNVRGGANFLNKDAHNKKNKRRAVKVFLLLLFIVLLTGISYGYVSKIINGSKLNKLTAGILDLDLYEGEELIIENLYPQADPVGLIQEESFNFKLINKTENPTNYILKLQRVETQDELALTDIVYGLTKDNTSSTGLLSELEEANYVVDSGTIKGKETINYELRFWLREDIENDTTTNNKTLKYTLRVGVSQYLTFNDFFENKVDTKTTIDFKKISSEINGRGIYKYTEDGEDIYYWRGKVDEVEGAANHLLFADMCWEIVRTTNTGGVKIIYDGLPVEVDGVKTCPNTGTASQLANKNAFNSSYNSLAYVGYMYGNTVYEYKTKTSSDAALTTAGILYGYDVEWTGTEYELKAKDGVSLFSSTGTWSTDRTSVGNGNHYTCFDSDGKCETVSYVYYTGSSSYPYYIDLSGGIIIEEALEQMYSNEKPSTMKTTIETWFESTDLDEEENLSKLEDVVYCNDRSVADMTTNGWNKDGDASKYMYYSSYTRVINGTPDLSCRQTSGNRDRFTYKDAVNGNGLLKWPIGLLTADEIMLVGGQLSSNNDYYLYTGENYWSLSPCSFYNNVAREFSVISTGSLDAITVYRSSGIRPVISLSSSVLPSLSGTGTETDPYVVN